MTSSETVVNVGNFSADPSRSFTMPSALYVDPQILAREREAIFWRSWMFVCHLSDVDEVGAYVTADIVGQPVFVIRSDDGELRSFYNVCQHRGHVLLEGNGTIGQRITCPYHAWAYDGRGQLRGARMSDRMDDFAFQDFTLPSVRLEVLAGFVFVNLDPDAAPMSEVYPGLVEELARHGLTDEPLVRVDTSVFEIAANWKNVGDNLLECYHCHPAHPGFVELIDMQGYRNECFENWSVQSGPAHRTNDTYNVGDGKASFASVFIWPNLSIGHLPGQRGHFTFQFTPTAAESSLQELIYFGPDAAASATEADAFAWFTDVLGPEDVALVENTQKGLRSKGYDQGRFICIPDRPEISEHAVHHFHQMVITALGIDHK